MFFLTLMKSKWFCINPRGAVVVMTIASLL
nr:MAG TPA: Tryptophanase operon leader peptide [Caudoviricetes sp.]